MGIIDTLADRLTRAVIDLQPFAQKVVAQYEKSALVWAVAFTLVAVVFAMSAGSFVVMARKQNMGRGHVETLYTIAAFSAVMTLVTTLASVAAWDRYVSPLPNMLGF